jgi:hypothetical protein
LLLQVGPVVALNRRRSRRSWRHQWLFDREILPHIAPAAAYKSWKTNGSVSKLDRCRTEPRAFGT